VTHPQENPVTDRRRFLRSAGAAVLPALLPSVLAAAEKVAGKSPDEAARDEDYWAAVRRGFHLDRRWIDLAGGGVSAVPREVMEAGRQYLEQAQSAVSASYDANYGGRTLARNRLAKLLNCDPGEVAVTRNTTEALNTALFGLPLKRGDEVVTTDQDYPSMVAALRQREKREGIKLVVVKTPVVPKSHDELVAAFEKAITPRTKAFLFCHVLCDTGQIYPAERLCALAKPHGIRTVIDGAHGFGHLPVDVKAIGCDYYGSSLHKWASGPMGSGFLYVRKDRIRETWPLFANAWDEYADRIEKFEMTGTRPPVASAILPALDLLEAVGVERKRARLHYLKRYWLDKLAGVPKVRVNTNPDPDHSCGVANVGINGIGGGELHDHLREKHRILTYSTHSSGVEGLQVTTQVYVRPADLDTFVAAIKAVAKEGIKS
jgi:selenocysteine lyase/cysteine desulfurase